jgi:hypothetical protein
MAIIFRQSHIPSLSLSIHLQKLPRIKNPFVTNGYVSPHYFCDRQQETEDITTLLRNGNNIALISPRRYGKADLIRHCFAQAEITADYYTFIVDIYATRSLRDLVNKLGKVILDTLKPRGRKAWEAFVNTLTSLQTSIRFRGGTFYLQKVMNVLFMRTPESGICTTDMIEESIRYIINFTADTYTELLYQLPDKQKEVLIAINREGEARNVASGSFAKRHGLLSPSSVRSALSGLLDKDFITKERDYYQVYDLFFAIWLEGEE